MRDKIVLSKGYEFSTDMNETGINSNIAVIGCTGSGKTCSVVIPRILNTYDTNLILTDPKRELFERYAPVLRSRGYDVRELNLDTPSKSSICFDPLKYVESSSDISKLAESVANLLPDSNASDKFWDYSSRCLIELLMRYVFEFKEDPTFYDFIKLSQTIREVDDNSSTAELSIYPVLKDFEKGYPDHPLTASFNTMREVPGKTLACILMTMRSALSSVFSDDISRMFISGENFDVDKFISSKSALFITTDGASEGTNAYVNYIYSTLIHMLMDKAKEYIDGVLPIPIHLIMDDFACGTKIKEFPHHISSFRSKGISSTIILQDESQLVSMYNDEGAKTIINNCDTLIYLGGNDIETARDISLRLNVPLGDVLYMPLGSIAFFRRGSHPVMAARYPLMENSEYRRIILEEEKRRKVFGNIKTQVCASDERRHNNHDGRSGGAA